MQMSDDCLGCGWKGAYSSRGGGQNGTRDGGVDGDGMDCNRAHDGGSYNTSIGKEHVFSLRASVPAYTAILDDGSRVELEDTEHVLSVNIANGYSVQHLIDDLASKTIWGTCQEPICWFWDLENKYLLLIFLLEVLSEEGYLCYREAKRMLSHLLSLTQSSASLCYPRKEELDFILKLALPCIHRNPKVLYRSKSGTVVPLV